MSEAQLSFRKSANIDRVTDKRKDSLFRLVDTDGSGTIDAQEFAVLYDAIKKDLAEELEKEAELQKEASSARRRFKMLLLFVLVLVSFLAASVAANFAVIFTVVDQAITTSTTNTGLLEVKGTDTIAKTAIATQDVPLIVAPALDLDTLAAAKSLKIKYRPETSGSEVVEAQVSVVAVRKHNATFVEFVTDVEGDVVEVLNGQAFLSRKPTTSNGLEAPELYEICAANATCSAFRASGIDVDAALDVVKQDLITHGYEEASRRLAPTYSSCDVSGTWTFEQHCGWKYTGGNPNWEFLGYCYPDQDGNSSLPIMENPVSPAWYEFPGFPPPTLYHPLAQGMTVHYWWPPAMAALNSVYYSGWSHTKHIVFFAPGKFGQWYAMYDTYCTPGTTLDCPDFQIPEFEHLVFVFGASGMLDVGLNDDGTPSAYYGAQGWSLDVYDSSTYSTAASTLSTYLFNTIKKYNDDGSGTDPTTGFIPAFDCEWKIFEECYWTKSLVFSDESRMAGARFSASPSKAGRMLAERRPMEEEHEQHYVQLKHCKKVRRKVCPFNWRSQIMIIGFSDGGGLGMYMNYHTSKVTKTVSIDFWAFNNVENFLTPMYTTLDATIYTSCASVVFRYGPKALVPMDSPPAGSVTYLEGASIWGDSFYTPPDTLNPDMTGGIEWMSFKWGSSWRSLEWLVHGIDKNAIPDIDIAGGSVTAAGDPEWAEVDSAGDLVSPHDLCTDNVIPADVHSNVLGYIDASEAKLHVDKWLGLARRRLSRMQGRVDIVTNDAFEEVKSVKDVFPTATAKSRDVFAAPIDTAKVEATNKKSWDGAPVSGTHVVNQVYYKPCKDCDPIPF